MFGFADFTHLVVMLPCPCLIGYDKANKMKIHDLGNPSADPERFQAADSIRFASYHQNDSLILSTYVDKPNIRYSSIYPPCTVI